MHGSVADVLKQVGSTDVARESVNIGLALNQLKLNLMGCVAPFKVFKQVEWTGCAIIFKHVSC